MSGSGAPGPVGRAILPQGPHALGARSAPNMNARGGMGVPPWGFLIWWGRLGRGGPGGETKAGEARRALCHHHHSRTGGRGVTQSNDRGVARDPLTIP